MPKKVDHTERRARIAAAAWELAAESGLDALTMRDVAAAAGMSLGQLQHYVPAKEELLELVSGSVHEWMVVRAVASAAAATMDDDGPPGRSVYRVLTAVLPFNLDAELPAHAAFDQLARATRDTRYAAAHRKTHDDLHALLVTKLRAGQRFGEVGLDRDVDEEARTLLALVAGLTAHVLAGTETRQGADKILRHHLERLFSE